MSFTHVKIVMESIKSNYGQNSNLKLKQSFPLGFLFQFCNIENVGIVFQKLAKLVELI
jgi:hypothetical protein